jgi:glutamate carboxypeptidase
MSKDMAHSTSLTVDEILSGIRSWIEIESPTDVPEAMARMAARVQADYEAIGVRVERIAGRDGQQRRLRTL